MRKGYTFDGCIHWLVGSREDGLMNNLWQELGALKDTEVVNHEEFMRFQDTDGRELILYTDIDRLEKHLLELSPADGKAIHEMAELIVKLGNFSPPMDKPRELMSAIDGLITIPRMMPRMSIFKKYGQMTMEEFMEQFSDPLLRKGLSAFAMGIPGFPARGC
jgi:phytoene desaturase